MHFIFGISLWSCIVVVCVCLCIDCLCVFCVVLCVLCALIFSDSSFFLFQSGGTSTPTSRVTMVRTTPSSLPSSVCTRARTPTATLSMLMRCLLRSLT